jgi:DNA recombination protein RmuC
MAIQEGRIAMTVILVGIVVVLVGVVAALGVVLVRQARYEVEWPDGLNADVLERLTRMEGDLDGRLRSLDGRVDGVTSMFASAQGRGGWGELSLRQALEHAGLVEDRDFSLNKATGQDANRPDAVIKLPDGRFVIIDAKFPMARFEEACRLDDGDDRTRLMGEHGRALLMMAKDLKGRGYHSAAAGGYVVMYLPDEGLYVEAMRARPQLFDEVRREQVLLAGPATLLALIGVTAQVINEHRAVEEARRIVADASELQNRLRIFATHLAAVGKKLNTAVAGYNTAVGSWESRLNPQVAKVVSHVPGGEEVPVPSVVETAVRQPVADDEQRLSVVG